MRYLCILQKETTSTIYTLFDSDIKQNPYDIAYMYIRRCTRSILFISLSHVFCSSVVGSMQPTKRVPCPTCPATAATSPPRTPVPDSSQSTTNRKSEIPRPRKLLVIRFIPCKFNIFDKRPQDRVRKKVSYYWNCWKSHQIAIFRYHIEMCGV
jgi:hypothetical protein